MDDIIRIGLQLDAADATFRASNAEQAFRRTARAADEMSGSVTRAAKSTHLLSEVLRTFIGIGTVIKFYRDLTSATVEHEQAEVRLRGVLDATGNSIGRTAEQVLSATEKLGRATLFEPAQFTQAATLFAQFGNISTEVFDRALTAAADLATVWRMDLPSAAAMLGKALTSPNEGLTALTRTMGQNFLGAQEQVVKALMEQGRIAEAQTIILDKLSEKMGGVAQRAAVGLAGAIHGARVEYDDFLASLGRTEQAMGPLQGIFAFFRQFFASRILTTERWEDEMIALDGYADALDRAKEAARVMNDVAARAPTEGRVRLSDAEKAALEGAADAAIKYLGIQERLDWLRGQGPVVRRGGIEVENLQAVTGQFNAMQVSAQRLFDQQTKTVEKLKEEDAARIRAAIAAAAEQGRIEELTDARRREAEALERYVEGLEAEQRQLGMTDAEKRRDVLENVPQFRGADRESNVLYQRASAAERAIHAYEILTEIYKSYEDAVQESIRTDRQAQSGVEQMVGALREQADTLGMSSTEVALYRIRVIAATMADKEYAERLVHTAEALAQQVEAHERNESALKRITEEQARLAQAQEAVWRRAFENVQDVFAQFITEIGATEDVFENFIRRILELWRDMMAQMAAQGFLRWLVGQIPSLAAGLGATGQNPRGPADIPGMSQVVPAHLPTLGGLGLVAAGSGGGVVVHQQVNFHIAALDQRGVAELLQDQQGVIAGIVAKAARESRSYHISLLRG